MHQQLFSKVALMLVQGTAGWAEHNSGHSVLQWVQPGGFPHDEPVLHRQGLLPLHVLPNVQGETQLHAASGTAVT